MAVKIRLARGGAKKKPFYQVVVADERCPRDGRFIEKLGQYDPKQDPPMFNIVEDRTLEWLSKGAQPTDSVAKIFRTTGCDVRYARFKKGEDIATLVAEAKAAEVARTGSPRTSQN